jgi:transcriptional regulator with XRE-family HTH domain
VRQELARAIGATIAHRRIANAMTQEQLALALDVDPMTVSRFERGVTLPSLPTLHEVAGVFGVTMAQMLEDAPSVPSGNISLVASLLKNLSQDEVGFIVDTIKRFRALKLRQRRKNPVSDEGR